MIADTSRLGETGTGEVRVPEHSRGSGSRSMRRCRPMGWITSGSGPPVLRIAGPIVDIVGEGPEIRTLHGAERETEQRGHQG